MHRSSMFATPSPLCCPLAAALLASFLACGQAAPPDPPALGPDDRQTPRRYTRDTWRSFEAMAQPSGLPADGLRRGDGGTWRPTEKTTPTDIAAYRSAIVD